MTEYKKVFVDTAPFIYFIEKNESKRNITYFHIETGKWNISQCFKN